jgi:uncharacterized protein (TIGR00369 family)
MSGSGDIPFDDGNCFACGPSNPIGLHLHFDRAETEGVRCSALLASQFQGWRGIAHGGIVMALLDEAMAHAAGFAGQRGVTASVSVRFRKPVPLERPIEIRGRVTWHRRNVLGVEAKIFDESGTLLAESDGSFVSRGPLEAASDRRNPEFKSARAQPPRPPLRGAP